MAEGDGPRSGGEPSVAELVKQLSEQTSTLARQEIELAKVELAEKGKRAGIGAGMFGGAGRQDRREGEGQGEGLGREGVGTREGRGSAGQGQGGLARLGRSSGRTGRAHRAPEPGAGGRAGRVRPGLSRRPTHEPVTEG